MAGQPPELAAAPIVHDETSPLLGQPLAVSQAAPASDAATADPEDAAGAEPGAVSAAAPSSVTVLGIVLVLVAGAFMSNVDGSLVLATHPTIASEFDALSWSSWLFVAFQLAGAATQSIVCLVASIFGPGASAKQDTKQYGKLSDMYGRRPVLVAAYALFALGCALIGAGGSMAQVVLGRVVSGCGAAALNVLGLLIITDIVPLREAASWQSGINLAAVSGRSLGAPLGGLLADLVGWRLSFMGQVPIFCAAIVFCLSRMPSNLPGQSHSGTHVSSTEPRSTDQADDHAQESGPMSPSKHAKPPARQPQGLARIDFLGAALLALTVVCVLLPIEVSRASDIPWTRNPAVLGLAAAACVFGALFVAVEERWALEPIFPIDLLRHRDVLLLYLVACTQAAAQFGLTFVVPLYFQVTQRSSNAASGASLVPAFIGNACGAILGGLVIKRTGRYKLLLIGATALSSSAYFIILLRWHGHTRAWEALEILPGGMGTGIVQTVIFVAIAATINPSHKAAAMSGLFLVSTVASTLGLAAVNAVTLGVMRARLDALLALAGFDLAMRDEIITKAAASIDYLDVADKGVADAVVRAYIDGLSASHIVSLVCSSLAFIGSVFVGERLLH
ncbi:hypothetical protein RB597_003005 [Gaeumannomyces tritici]